jgi:hypothetical protein
MDKVGCYSCECSVRRPGRQDCHFFGLSEDLVLCTCIAGGSIVLQVFIDLIRGFDDVLDSVS